MTTEPISEESKQLLSNYVSLMKNHGMTDETCLYQLGSRFGDTVSPEEAADLITMWNNGEIE